MPDKYYNPDELKTIEYVLAEVRGERFEQFAKWGTQDHPNGTGTEPHDKTKADMYRAYCEENFSKGEGTWRDILLEEVYEAMAEEDAYALREELIQVAAVCVAWCQAIDRADTARWDKIWEAEAQSLQDSYGEEGFILWSGPKKRDE